jgi:CRP/FNR family transcriptional regulator, cyclic AMP receptor protein
MDVNKNKVLRDQTLFSKASEEVLCRAGSLMRVVEYRPGDFVFYQGDPRSPLALVVSGQLRSSAVSEDGTEVPIRAINAGESVGEMAILRSLPSPGNVAATKKSSVALINRADARPLFDDPGVARMLNGILALQLRRFVERHAAQGLPRADSRVSAVIESAIQNTEGNEYATIDLPDQATIAAMAKVSRETVSRVLKRLELRGIISKEGRRIQVRDRAALHNLVTG